MNLREKGSNNPSRRRGTHSSKEVSKKKNKKKCVLQRLKEKDKSMSEKVKLTQQTRAR